MNLEIISTYKELFKNKGIFCSVAGEKVDLRLQLDISGDILIFLGPKEKGAYTVAQILELAGNDEQLKSQKETALTTLQKKYKGLVALPKMISFLINVASILIAFYFMLPDIAAVIHQGFNLHETSGISALILPVLTFIFRNTIGFNLISVFIRLVLFFRRILQRIKII